MYHNVRCRRVPASTLPEAGMKEKTRLQRPDSEAGGVPALGRRHYRTRRPALHR